MPAVVAGAIAGGATGRRRRLEFAAREAIVAIGVEPAEGRLVPVPLVRSDRAVPVDVHRRELVAVFRPPRSFRLLAGQHTVMVLVERLEHRAAAVPLVPRDAPVAIDVE